MNKAKAIIGVGITLLTMHCSSPAPGEHQGETQGAMSSSISTTYGVTTFGGPGDYQAMACGGNSRTANKWYVASSQRYGCHVHLKVVAKNGKCVVVSTEDAGPASFVESKAGRPVLDSSPAVASYLFGESGLGWSDLKGGKYDVTVTKTTAAVGPCAGDGTEDLPDSPGDDGEPEPGGGGSSSSSSSSGGSSGGAACSGDGQCNPGSNGSGKICVGGQCVPGCHHDYQCPGNTTCVAGQCE